MKSSLLIILSVFLFISSQLNGQEIPKNVNPNDLSNSQVKEAKQALDNSGLSREAAVQVARQKGASEQQIQDMLKRMDALGNSAPNTTDVLVTEDKLEVNQEKQEKDDALKENIDTEINDLSKRTTGFSSAGDRFGAYLFNSANITFEPNPNIPTPKNYQINIGDQILVSIWGNSQASYQLVVNRNGQIMIPDIGPIYLAGLSFEDAEQKLVDKLSTIYSDMKGTSPSTFAQIDLGKMRSIKVNIIGEAVTPGTYTLPATASLFNALYLSGGPNKIGSFRSIQIIRDNKVFKTVDIYKYLIYGVQSENHILQDEDIIFIPTIEKQVKVSGEFKRNALFELKDQENLSNLIEYAGAYTDETYLYRMKLYRKTQEGLRIIDFLQSDINTIKPENGDMLVSERILDQFRNRVIINGAVFRPGEYEWKQGMKLSELINKADSITPDIYTKQGHIIRLKEDLSNLLIPFDVNDIISGTKDYELLPEDLVTVKSHFQMEEAKYFAVVGHVNAPATFVFMDSIRISDAIYLANGLKEGAYGKGHIVRTNPNDKSLRFISFNIDDVLNGTGNDYLQNEDIVSIKSVKQLKESETINVSGEVITPNTFQYMKDMTLRDAIYLANGFKEGADSSYIEVSRRLGYERESQLSDTLRYTFYFTLPRNLTDDNTSSQFVLQPYDRISVRRSPGYRDPEEASILGEVKFAGRYSLNRKSMRISDLIDKAGGLTPEAYAEGAYFQRQNNGLGAEVVGIELNKILSNANCKDDLFLMDGDILIIPKRLQTVKVTGNILNPLSVTYVPARTIKYYVSKTGGFNEDTRKSKIYVRYPNGTTATTKRFLGIKSYPTVKPGSEIVIPKKPEKERSDQTAKWLGIASTMSSLAIALSYLLKQMLDKRQKILDDRYKIQDDR